MTENFRKVFKLYKSKFEALELQYNELYERNKQLKKQHTDLEEEHKKLILENIELKKKINKLEYQLTQKKPSYYERNKDKIKEHRKNTYDPVKRRELYLKMKAKKAKKQE